MNAQSGLYDRVAQAFAVFLPVKVRGLQGDGRRYDYVVALRAGGDIDFMSARWAHCLTSSWTTCPAIINETQGISRVVYDISGSAGHIEWE